LDWTSTTDLGIEVTLHPADKNVAYENVTDENVADENVADENASQ